MSFKEEKAMNTNRKLRINIKQNVKEIIERRMTPSNKKQKILSLLFSYVSEKKFLDIFMQSFKLNPEFFKGWLYEDLLHKVEKSYGNEKRKEFEIDIIEKYCLFNGEQLLYVCKGNISQRRRSSYRFYVDRGTLFVTTDRIIALGRLKVFESKSLFFSFGEYEKAKNFMMGLSGQKELLLLGNQFPISNHYNLKKKSRSIKYEVNQGTHIEISFTKSINSTYSIEERRDRLFEILDKEIIISSLKTEDLVKEELAVEEPIEVKEEVLPEEEEVVKLLEVCKFCGANILAGKTYCSNCGKLLKIPIEEKVSEQKELVVEKPFEEEFLPKEEFVVEEPIEEKVLQEEAVAEEPIEEEVIPEEEIVVKEPVEEILFSCKFCGMKLDKYTGFCPQCGTIIKKK